MVSYAREEGLTVCGIFKVVRHHGEKLGEDAASGPDVDCEAIDVIL